MITDTIIDSYPVATWIYKHHHVVISKTSQIVNVTPTSLLNVKVGA
jgi:hypothetical protein